jgi:hypothetical protein
MPFTPIRLVSPAGVVVPVGSATEREHLLARGYQAVEPEPEKAEPKREPVKRTHRTPAAPEPVEKTEPEAKTK